MMGSFLWRFCLKSPSVCYFSQCLTFLIVINMHAREDTPHAVCCFVSILFCLIVEFIQLQGRKDIRGSRYFLAYRMSISQKVFLCQYFFVFVIDTI